MRWSIVASFLAVLIASPLAAQTPPAAPPAAGTAPAAGPAPAAAPDAGKRKAKPKLSPDERKAKSKGCSEEADKQGLHGKARKAFRSKCMRADAAPAALSPEEAAARARKQAEAKSAAWDAKMKKVMGAICSGC
jgi:hypothetical protein